MDLDGAKSKHIVNDAVLKSITTETNLVVDFGGGIKTEEDIEKAFAAGASMVTVGSIAVTNPDLFMEWIDKYGADKLILGADVRNGKISINGWRILQKTSSPSSRNTSTRVCAMCSAQKSARMAPCRDLPSNYIKR